ncbi:MAG: hypothetical protein N2110_08340 [Flavobacteriales bacterium]|nr:hypothetical protein [Flavobacteriales bacterium]MCX7769016.1 hypothetical protein [Flavobacteriales bacterium]MDW8410195.1 hypothetical protein [Flavobacteriales bacterium]
MKRTFFLLMVGMTYQATAQPIVVRVQWTGEVCSSAPHRLLMDDISRPKDATGLTLTFRAQSNGREVKATVGSHSLLQLSLEAGTWEVFAPEKRRHYGSLAEKDSLCQQWKNTPNALLTFTSLMRDTLQLHLHRTCAPCLTLIKPVE